MQSPVIRLSWTCPEEFVEFWLPAYKDPREYYYVDNIRRPLTPETVRRLYCWKNNGWMPGGSAQSVEQNVVGRLDELEQLDKDYSPLEFLVHFAGGGMIWRIFFLHIWQPDKYPVYDQHTYRAMRFIQERLIEEIPSNPVTIARLYVNDYIPFFNGFPQVPERGVDKALFAFGKFLNTPLGRQAAAADEQHGA